jgi:putative addiction module killer protein
MPCASVVSETILLHNHLIHVKYSSNIFVTWLSIIVYRLPVVYYSWQMVEIIKSDVFDEWFSRLKDRRAVARIAVRVDRLATGNPGDMKPIGGGLSEMRIDYGPGYRVYYMQRGQIVIVLLCGGDKTTQARDIEAAKSLAALWKD